MYLKAFFSVLSLILLFCGCQEKKEDEYRPAYAETSVSSYAKVYTFGVHPLHNPEHLFEVYEPMIEYINRHLEGSELRLEASRNYDSFDRKLFAGHFHFALPNPYQTVVSIEKGYRVFGKMGDDENFKGIILIRKESKFKDIKELKGRVVSYPAPTALAATMMPQWYMHEHGLDINRDINNSYVGSQESSIMNVYLGTSSAASTWPAPWHALIKRRPEIAKEVKIGWETASLPNNALVVRKDVPPALVKKVGELIFSMHTHEEGRKILEGMELSRYERADDQTYLPVKAFLKQFEREVRPIRLNR